jgi:hypothetical protein
MLLVSCSHVHCHWKRHVHHHHGRCCCCGNRNPHHAIRSSRSRRPSRIRHAKNNRTNNSPGHSNRRSTNRSCVRLRRKAVHLRVPALGGRRFDRRHCKAEPTARYQQSQQGHSATALPSPRPARNFA